MQRAPGSSGHARTGAPGINAGSGMAAECERARLERASWQQCWPCEVSQKRAGTLRKRFLPTAQAMRWAVAASRRAWSARPGRNGGSEKCTGSETTRTRRS
eukprot:6573827-Pyramimonas_sp.AAC.1